MKSSAMSLCMLVAFCGHVSAQSFPSSADPTRIKPLKQLEKFEKNKGKMLNIVIPKLDTKAQIPESAKAITVNLNNIQLSGHRIFNQERIQKIYQPYLNQDITLDKVWTIAEKITKFYKDQGYFLSRAYVPAQNINKNTVKISIVEGFIYDVDIDLKFMKRSLVQALVRRLKAQQPASNADLEAFMLQMNAIPGYQFTTFIEPIANTIDGAVKLSLKAQETNASGSLKLDNSGSRFLGPYHATLTLQDSFIPFQQTTLSAFSSTQIDEIKYVAFRHEIPFAADWKVHFSASHVRARPGASLRPNAIDSQSVDLGIGIDFQPIRQRQENLTFSFTLDGRNANTNVAGNNALTRDRIRVIRTSVNYDVAGLWRNQYNFNMQLSQGLAFLGASERGSALLSRAEARPDFTTLRMDYTQEKTFLDSWLAIGKVSGQYASAPLFSVEEFGYGGQGFGRAFDPSEITGDHGVNAGLELRYQGLDISKNAYVQPFAFYDMGKVWNEDTGEKPVSASSTGFGILVGHNMGLSGSIGLAWPLTRRIENPIYGNGKNPRILLSISQGF